MHIFRSTIEKFIETNAYVLESHSRFHIGTSRIGNYEVEDAFLTLTPSVTTKGYVPKLEFIENQGIVVTYSDFHFEGEGKVQRKKAKFYGDIKTLKCSFRLAPPVNDHHKIDLVPEFRMESVFIDYEQSTLAIEYEGKKTNSPGIKNHIKDWVKNSIDGQFNLARMFFAAAHNAVANLIESYMDMKFFKGSIRLTKFHFYPDYLDIGFNFEFEKYPDSEFISKVGRFNDVHKPNQEGVELIFDENIINTVLYAMYHLDREVSLRTMLTPVKDALQYLKVIRF